MSLVLWILPRRILLDLQPYASQSHEARRFITWSNINNWRMSKETIELVRRVFAPPTLIEINLCIISLVSVRQNRFIARSINLTVIRVRQRYFRTTVLFACLCHSWCTSLSCNISNFELVVVSRDRSMSSHQPNERSAFQWDILDRRKDTEGIANSFTGLESEFPSSPTCMSIV